MGARTIESVEKRARRLKRERLKLDRFRQQVALYRDLKWEWRGDIFSRLASFTATWDAVRRVAGHAMGVGWIPDVQTAWCVFYFVLKLPDGQKRIGVAIDAALAQWEIEVR